MLRLLAFGDHEALMADTPLSQNVDSTSTEQQLLYVSDNWNKHKLKEGQCKINILLSRVFILRKRISILRQQNHHFCLELTPQKAAQTPWPPPLWE